jgi:proton-translocating NADH-quinone oxidoreductase chain L
MEDLYAWFVFLSPLIAAPIALVAGKYRKDLAGIVASLSIAISLVLSYLLYLNGSSGNIVTSQVNWFYNLDYGVFVDHLTIVMIMMVSFVSLMIHLFAMYYMKKDPNRHVYFAETAMFTAGMLGLVESSNLLEFFLFWELVGLCSYLLIGFWFFKPNATAAAKKAFIVTRVGDLLFLVGLAVLYTSLSPYSSVTADPLSISFIVSHASSLPALIGKENLTIISLLLLGGAIGKSSQFPLHVWIPDAMEGPTTVSALIHAATMVTAGIYLVARVYPLFAEAYPISLYTVAFIGSFTAIFAGTIGLVVNDLKRILAYSTISQLGYMMAALGLGGILGGEVISFSLYHLVVHAFFKALLFLTAGAILIALMDVRDVRKMGGLWRKMPITISLMFIGVVTLAAVPYTAAFFSKDTIIDASYLFYTQQNSFLFAIPWIFLEIGSFMTVLYTFRMFFLVALGKPRSHLASEAKDPSIWALLPLFPLAILSLIYGIYQSDFYNFINPSTIIPTVPLMIELIPIVFLVIGVIVTYFIYSGEAWKRIRFSAVPGYKILKNKYYLDSAFTNGIAQRGILPLSSAFSGFEYSYNRGVEALGRSVVSLGKGFRKLQSGIVENYFMVIIVTAAVVLLILELLGGL